MLITYPHSVSFFIAITIYSRSNSINTNEFSFKDMFKIKLPKVKLPKFPKLPEFKS